MRQRRSVLTHPLTAALCYTSHSQLSSLYTSLTHPLPPYDCYDNDTIDTSGLHSQPLAALASVSAHEIMETITDPAQASTLLQHENSLRQFPIYPQSYTHKQT